ncbi:MAG: type I restriction endonuclease subunit R [Chitinophagaceae bacterium]
MDANLFREHLSAQLPAVQLLVKMGYAYLSQEKALELRGGKTTQVLLEEVLRKQLKAINSIQVSSSRTSVFSDANIENGILALRNLPMNNGYIAACAAAYDLLRYGKDLEQSIDGDKKSFTLRYIDWEQPENNVFHVTEEFSVMKNGSREHLRPDIVLFVNGIPVTIIECKRPDMKDPLGQAISQHIRNQQEGGIRNLYVYSQLLLATAMSQAAYATTDTKEEFWATWKEPVPEALSRLVNTPLAPRELESILSHREAPEKQFLFSREEGQVSVTEQDKYLYALCRPERLLELIKDFIVFEAGRFKKIARYQQYFAIRKILKRVAHVEGGKRNGGVIWHTQGSGKSLTMAMLARAIHLQVKHARIILVTDRVELDSQITETFGKVHVPVVNATTGNKLVALLQSKSDAVITTVINKFEAAVNQLGNTPVESPDVFVLIDEGHRTQYGTFNTKMQKVLPNACFLAFTGTPLMKKEKSTAQKFGGIIDAYTILQAVEDKAIVPIIYEGRHVVQSVNEKALNKGFERITADVPEAVQREWKRRYSKGRALSGTEQYILEAANDISTHFHSNWGPDATGESAGFKGMVVTPDKATAVKYKQAFDLIGKVTTEVIMSPPDDREGNEDVHEAPADDVLAFWKKMEAKHGKDFETTLINQFRKAAEPELLIVVDKLLTGFDEPRVIAMYICRKLKEHTLLQAIARVNRVAEGKECGFIIDYAGILGELDQAMNTYTNLEEFDSEDLNGILTDIKKAIAELPQRHAALNDLFRQVKNRFNLMAYLEILSDVSTKDLFYERFSAFARCLKMALSSIDFERNTPDSIKEEYKNHLRFFARLRAAAVSTYSDEIEVKRYEKQLQKLLDQHVTAEEVIRLTEQVSIMDAEAFEKELAKVTGGRAQAEMIASRTAKHINEKMEEDPVFYKQLSQLIREALDDLRTQRISEAEAIKKLKEYREKAISKKDADVPEVLLEKEQCIPFFRLLKSSGNFTADQTVAFAEATDAIIRKYKVVDWQHKADVTRRINFHIGEYLIDELNMEVEQAEELANRCEEIAKARYRG